MYKFSVSTLLLSLSLAGLPLTGNAATGSVNQASIPFSVKCTNKNFSGEAKGHYFDYGHTKSIYLNEYRITRSNNQSGGNKANVNMTAANLYGSGSKEVKSPDSMKQDGQWNALRMNIPAAPWAATQIGVEFIFDRSGSDPRCTARVNI